MRAMQYVTRLWTTGPQRYAPTARAGTVRPLIAKTDRFAWGAASKLDGTGTGFIQAPMLGRDTGYREFHEHLQGSATPPPYYTMTKVVGTFDPNKLAGAASALDPFHAPDAQIEGGAAGRSRPTATPRAT